MTEESLLSSLNRALGSIILLGVIATFNHYFVLGAKTWVIFAITVILPILTVIWFKRTKSSISMNILTGLAAFYCIGFGFVNGFLNHTLGLLGFFLVNSLEQLHGMPATATYNSVFLEDISGIFLFLSSIPIVAYMIKLRREFSIYKEEQA